MHFRCTFWYKIQISSPMTNLFKKGSLSCRWRSKSHVETRFIRPVSVNSCRIQTLHWLTYFILIRWSCIVVLMLLEIFLHTIASTLYREFSRTWLWYPSLLDSCCGFHLSSQFLKPIADDNSYSTTPINSTNLVRSIIYTIIFFKTLKHNMSQMFPFERCKKKF